MVSIDPGSGPSAPARLRLVPAIAGAFGFCVETAIVRLEGSLTAPSRSDVRLRLLRLVEADDAPEEIVLDLSRVSSVDDAGLRPLLEAHRLQVARGGRLRLIAVSRAVAVHLYADQSVANVLMPGFAIDQPYYGVPDARWFDVVSDDDGAS